MKERPIINGYEIAGRLPPFKPALRQAIRDDRKTMTRRVVKPQPPKIVFGLSRLCPDHQKIWKNKDGGWSYWVDGSSWCDIRCPYGKPGEYRVLIEPLKVGCLGACAYYADDGEPVILQDGSRLKWKWSKKTLSSIHMPYTAARTIVQIKDIRVERLQDITEQDAQAEGARWKDFGRNKYNQQMPGWSMEGPFPDHFGKCLNTARLAFGNYINKIHGGENWNLKPSNLWDENPWVWCVSFKRVED